MPSADLSRRKCGCLLVVKTTAGMPVSPFHKGILHTRVVISNKRLSCTYMGCNIALIILYLTSLIDFNQFIWTMPLRYKSKSKNDRNSPESTDSS